MTNEANAPLKSMRLFFIDNQGAWPTASDGTSKAQLVGDLVVWPDAGKYPSFVPLAAAKHPHFDGTIVVMGGSRGLVVAFCKGAHDEAQVRQQMSKGQPEQYRIALDAIVHRLMLWRDESDQGESDEAAPLAILSWLASSQSGRGMAQVMIAALSDFLAKAERVKEVSKTLPAETDAFNAADAMLTTLQMSVAQRGAQATSTGVKRR